jgi:hypothetical protein
MVLFRPYDFSKYCPFKAVMYGDTPCQFCISLYSPYMLIDISLSRQLFKQYQISVILDHLSMKGGMA